jgi:hypothetical protein
MSSHGPVHGRGKNRAISNYTTSRLKPVGALTILEHGGVLLRVADSILVVPGTRPGRRLTDSG